jgi:hypothetical protein
MQLISGAASTGNFQVAFNNNSGSVIMNTFTTAESTLYPIAFSTVQNLVSGGSYSILYFNTTGDTIIMQVPSLSVVRLA